MKLENTILMDLQHFDGGAAGGAAAGGTGVAAPTVSGGTPDNASQGAPDDAAAKERREKWKSTKAEYKDLYGEEVETTVKDRLKKFKPIEDEHKTLTQRIAKLQELAGVEDIDSLEATLSEQQQRRLEDAAYDKGMTIDEYKAEMQKEKDAEAYRKLQQRDQFIQRMTSQWQEQANVLQKTYPDFDLQRASTNPVFVELLRSGRDVRVAYEAANAGQILSQVADYQGFPFETWTANKAFVALLENGFPIRNAFEATELDWTKQRTAKEMEKRVADSIRSGRRVPEAGANQKPGEGRSTNVSGLTSKERARLMEDFRTGKKNPRDYGM